MPTRARFARLFRNWPAKVLSFAAALLLLVIHDITRLEERFLTVPLEVRLNETVVPASQYPTQVRLRLRGESETVFAVPEAELAAYVDLRPYLREGEFRVAVTVERLGVVREGVTLEITSEPEAIDVTLEERLVRTIEVEPATTSFPVSGYELVQVLATPSQVEVEGPRTQVEQIERVRTEELDLASRREDFTERMRLQRPHPLVRFPGGEVVEVRVIIDEAVVLQTFEPVDFVVTGLREELSIAQNLPTGLVRVQAPQLAIGEIVSGDVALSVDASSLTDPGTWRLPVQPIVPQGFVVLRYEPTSIQIVVEESE